MGLDSYIFAETVDDDGNISTELEEIAYWRKVHYLHNLCCLKGTYADLPQNEGKEHYIDNCIYFDISHVLNDIYDVLKKQSVLTSLDAHQDPYHTIYTEEVDEFTKVLKYHEDNPNLKIYYYGWY